MNEEAITALIQRALTDTAQGLGHLQIDLAPAAMTFLATICDGDARRALTALEVAALSTPPDADGVIRLTHSVVEECVQRKMVLYDRDEDGHYDTISAFIKSVRGSDPHAAVYWLAKMLEAGEDPRFIARRLIILASEDIGNADPRGLTVAVAAMQAVEFIGMPEARISWRKPPPTSPPRPRATPPTWPWKKRSRMCVPAECWLCRSISKTCMLRRSAATNLMSLTNTRMITTSTPSGRTIFRSTGTITGLPPKVMKRPSANV